MTIQYTKEPTKKYTAYFTTNVMKVKRKLGLGINHSILIKKKSTGKKKHKLLLVLIH